MGYIDLIWEKVNPARSRVLCFLGYGDDEIMNKRD
jgi:hypothetical protein